MSGLEKRRVVDYLNNCQHCRAGPSSKPFRREVVGYEASMFCSAAVEIGNQPPDPAGRVGHADLGCGPRPCVLSRRSDDRAGRRRWDTGSSRRRWWSRTSAGSAATRRWRGSGRSPRRWFPRSRSGRRRCPGIGPWFHGLSSGNVDLRCPHVGRQAAPALISACLHLDSVSDRIARVRSDLFWGARFS
jgi:hypothetical protein